MTGTRIIIATLFLAQAVFCSTADESTEIKSLEEIVEYGIEHNRNLDVAAYNVWAARETLVGTIKLDDTSLSGTGTWNSTPASDQENVSGQLKLDVPVTDRISLSGTWDLKESGSAGIVVKPLSLSSTARESEGTLKTAEIQLEYLSASLENDIVLIVLNYQSAQEDFQLKKDAALLTEKKYHAGFALYSRGEITYDDLQDLNDDLTDAQKAEIEAQITLSDRKAEYVLMLGTEVEFLPENKSSEELQILVEVQKEAIAGLSGKTGSSSGLETAMVSYDTALARLDSKLVFQPDLSISAEASFTAGTVPSLQAGISLSISPDNFDQEERKLLAEKADQELTDVLMEEFNLQIGIQSARDRISAAEKEVLIAKTDLERREIIYKETVLLYEQGERTVLEEEDSELGYREGYLNLFNAMISLFEAQSDLLEYYI